MSGRDRPLAFRRRLAGPWTALAVLPVVALVVPASLVLSGPLLSNGWPARLIIFWIAAGILLGWAHLRRRPAPVAPVVYGSWLLLLGLVSALSAAGLRELTEVESAGAIRFALVMLPLVVVAVGIAQTAGTRGSDLLLAALVLGATCSALVGVAQFVSPFQWDAVLRLPGLVAGASDGAGTRGGFARVQGAAAHPIEYGTISAALAPVAVHLARFAHRRATRQLAGLATVIIVISIPMSVSRSGVVLLVVSMAVYATALKPRQRVFLLVAALAGILVFRAAVPGLLGTVLSIFTGASTDDSITGRTDDYTAIFDLWREQPVIGYGLGTFRPEAFFFLDNQYLMALVEGGVLLLVVTVLWFFLAMSSARGAARRAVTLADRSRATAVLGGLLALAVSGLFFDLFSFAQATIVTFLLAGIAGALWSDGVTHGAPLPSLRARLSELRPPTPQPWQHDDDAPVGPVVRPASDAKRDG